MMFWCVNSTELPTILLNMLNDANLKTTLADAFLESLHVDLYNNIKADFDVKGSKHTVTLNTKATTRGNNLEKVREYLCKCKQEILQCMTENIIDQNSDSSLATLMAVFDLASEEEHEPRVQKVEALYNIYALDTEHTLEDWHNFKVKATYKKRIICSKQVLIEEFHIIYQKMNVMACRLREAKLKKKNLLR